MATTQQELKSNIVTAYRYNDAPAAMEWLKNVLGFSEHAVFKGDDGLINHAELTLGNGMIMLGSQKDDEYGKNFKSPKELGAETRAIYIVAPDADAVYARCVAAGAEIPRPMEDTHYGSREFTVKDPEGHSWSVGTYDPWQAKG